MKRLAILGTVLAVVALTAACGDDDTGGDGTELAATATNFQFSPDLWTVTLDGKVTRLTDDGYVYSDAAYSPDGRYISYVRDPGTDMIIQQKLNHGGPSDLYIRPVAGGAPINLTATWDLEPASDTLWASIRRHLSDNDGQHRGMFVQKEGLENSALSNFFLCRLLSAEWGASREYLGNYNVALQFRTESWL